VKLAGADKKTIDRKKMEYAYSPLPGSVVVHNENDNSRSFAVSVGGHSFQYMLPGGALATFTWPASPFLDDGLLQLDPHGMTASAQPPGSIDPCCTADVAANAVDDDATTRWTTGTGQQPGQYLQVDLGRSQPVSRLVLDTGASTNATGASSGDYPRGYALYVSQDGSTWEGPVATGVGAGQLTDIEVPGGSVRYLRMVSTAASSSWWSVADLRVYRAASTAAVTGRATPLSGASPSPA
jgi:glucosylceramidase